MIDVAVMELGVQNLLGSVYAVIPGKGITEGNGQKVIGHAVISEHFKAQEQGRHRAVGNATE